MAPLRLWALELMSKPRRKEPAPVMILGVRSDDLAVPPYQLNQYGMRPRWATDDGSRGYHGTAVGLFEHLVNAGKLDPAHMCVYGCGPEPMMSALARVCTALRTSCEVSMERSMPCGYGVCMGCVVRGVNGTGYETYKRVCRDGPVFNAAEIVF